MMAQQKWTTIVLAVMSLGLWGYLVAFEHTFQDFNPPQQVADRFFKGQRHQYSRLVIEGEYGRMVFAATEESDEDEEGHPHDPKWRMTEPLEDAADGTAVTDIISQVTALRKGEPIEGEEEAVYGLDDPRLSIELEGEIDKAKVEVGKQTPLGTSVYVRISGLTYVDEEAVWVVAGSFVNSALRPAEGFRSRSLGTISPSEIRKIELESRKGGAAQSITMAKTDKMRPWQMSAPYAEPCDPGTVDGLLMALLRTRAEEFVDGEADPAAYGLAEPLLTVTLSDEEGRVKFGPVSIGRVEKDGATRWYGRSPDRKTILFLGVGVQGLDVDADHFRLRKIFKPLTGADLVDSFVGFRFGPVEDHWTLNQDAKTGAWRIVLHSPVPGQAFDFAVNAQALRDLKDILRKFEIAEFVTEAPTPEQLEEWGLKKPVWELGFALPDATGNSILFGKVEGEGAEQTVYAQIDGRGDAVVRLAADAAKLSLPDNHRVEDFRDRLVWEVPADAKVVSISTSLGKTAAPDAEGKWPEESKYWPYRIRRIVTRDYPAGWASVTGQVAAPAASLTIGWEDAQGEKHETVIRYEQVPERPKAEEEEKPDAPKEVKASIDGVEGIFYLIPYQVWDHLDVPEPTE